jgi:hypothetical protein
MEHPDDSDEEMELMCEVENLQLRLEKAGKPVNPMMEKHFAASIASATETSDRIKKWKRRVQQLNKLLDTLLAPSEQPAAPVLPVIGDTRQPSQQPATYMAGGVKLEPASTIVKLEPQQPTAKRVRREPNYGRNLSYRIYEDGSAPIMAPIHVAFITECKKFFTKQCRELMRQPNMTELINMWNDNHAHLWEGSNAHPQGGQRGSGRADNFFVNRYIKMEELRRIA